MKTGLVEKSSFENRVKSQSTEKNKWLAATLSSIGIQRAG